MTLVAIAETSTRGQSFTGLLPYPTTYIRTFSPLKRENEVRILGVGFHLSSAQNAPPLCLRNVGNAVQVRGKPGSNLVRLALRLAKHFADSRIVTPGFAVRSPRD